MPRKGMLPLSRIAPTGPAGSAGINTSLQAPGAVTGLALSSATSTSLTLTWILPIAGGMVSSIIVQYTVHGGSTYTVAQGSLGGNTLTYTISGLTASTAYDVQVLTVNATAPSGVAASLANISTSAATLAVPGAVTGLAVGTPTSTTLPLTWTAPSTGGAVSNYTVQYRTPSGSGSYTVSSAVVAASATAYTIPSLAAATAYDVQVFATNASGAGTPATVTNTSTAGTVPGAITALTLGAATSTTLPVTWTLPSSGGAISNITVQYRTPSGSGSYTVFSAVVGPTATGTTITGLTASTAYDVQVFATNGIGAGTAAQLTNVSTTAAGTVPGAITALTLGTPTSTTLPLTWTNPTSGGSATAITVQYRTPSGSGSYTVASAAVSASQTSYTITGLTAATAYDVQVFATNSTGSGTPGQLTNVSTAAAAAPGAITSLTNPSVTTSAVPLSWTLPTTGGTITNITVQYRPHGSGGWSTASSTVASTATAYTVQDLAASTAYDFQVFATNSNGNGTAATLSNVTTSGGTLPISSYPGLNPNITQNTSYSLSTNGGYVSGSCSGYAAGASSGTLPGAVWFYLTQNPASVPAIGATISPTGGGQITSAQDGYLYFFTIQNPSSTGVWYVYALSTTSSSSSSPGVVAGSLISPPITFTA